MELDFYNHRRMQNFIGGGGFNKTFQNRAMECANTWLKLPYKSFHRWFSMRWRAQRTERRDPSYIYTLSLIHI